MKQTIYIGVVSLFLLSACSHNEHKEHATSAEAHSHHHEAGEEAHGTASDEIVLSPEKAQALGVTVETVQPETFRQVIKTGGQILTAQGDERTVVAPVSGVVSFGKKQLVEGTPVGRGSVLLTLSSRHIAGGDVAEQARIAYEAAGKEYERMKALVVNQIVSQKEFTQAEQTYQNAKLAYEAVSAGSSTEGGTVVTAPLEGYIKSLPVQEGQYVEAGTPLLSVTQNQTLFLRADVSEKYYQYLSSITSANFCTPYNNKVYSLDAMNGSVLSYGKASAENNFYIPVTFRFVNKGDVIPGSYVEVFLLSSPMERVIAVPRTALTEEQGSFFVYLQEDEECYRRQLVTTGADNGERVQLLSGVHAGDKVVTTGAYQVKLAGATSAIPAHTHEH
jgi:RND family efflux transporter MFP subunit